ncbi:MAG: glucose-6-phosphate dehydrogenase [Firmicutes bacterium HGW-Firmicutes-7]|nr:MAG: glucose-6-phosphate dehydrogenase [Firmicutes bacterium HGW-Firmicutes-7]
MNNQRIIFTIFGGTGNLAYNKLFPAFYQLFQEEKFDSNIFFVAIGRREKTNEQYRKEVEDKIKKKNPDYSKRSFDSFKQRIYYYQLDFTNELHYAAFNNFMINLDQAHQTDGNRIYYLATAPTDFPAISAYLDKYCLKGKKGFKRAVFEKPFGYDLESATQINNSISAVFGENNIYRIDHYLGKEMIQNILTIRFTNQIFKAVWNKESIDNVQITVKESNGVEERGGYYDQSGALRDMIQNHLLQILAFIAMEQPRSFETDSIRDEKVKVLNNIKIIPDLKSHENIVFGQYEGYLQEEKVKPHSKTETYVAIKCEIDHPTWEGVPFYLRTGKFLNGKEAEIIIEFKKEVLGEPFGCLAQPNLLVIKIQPEEGIYFRINTKKPRSEKELMPVSMDYCQSCNFIYQSPEAYERLLNDIIAGDSTLFTRWDEVEAAWKIIKHLMSSCTKDDYLVSYEKGSEGPIEAEYLIKATHRKWWNIEDLSNSRFDF